ncbi:MAG: TetR/AcrR family transcriptional regulator [Bacteroidetes bacterium]|nr:TetR/AcrR family transcriptional regulator [Bacteroidota bacterium]
MEDTRYKILLENFRAIHRQGFQSTRTDKVVAELGITKGAFYHYFPTKNDLGYAIVDEILCPMYTGIWVAFEQAESNHAVILEDTLKKYVHLLTDQDVQYGCALNNLTQEMAPIDAGFQARLKKVILSMHRSIEEGLKNGQIAGAFRTDFNPTQMAFFILSTIEGAFSVGKATRSKVIFEMGLMQLLEFVKTLRR